MIARVRVGVVLRACDRISQEAGNLDPHRHHELLKLLAVMAAIADAMPILERAKAVDIVIVAEERKQEEIAGANMIQHLARHGIPASAR